MIKLKVDDVYEGVIEFSNGGNASIKIENRNVFIFKKNTLNSLNLDTVKVKIILKGKKLEAEVIEILERAKTRFVGRVQINGKLIFVIPDNQKVPVDFYIKGTTDAVNGQKVLIEFIDWQVGEKSPKAKIIEVIGNSGENNTEINSIMYEYGLPNEFPFIVDAESEMISEEISQNEIDRRRDLRHVTTIGIDPFDSKDADDTIGLEFINGERFISINIADVTHYVKENTELDKEAYERGSSVYLVDRVIPMIPKRLSNNICSLKSGSDKLCYSAIFKVDNNGEVQESWFGRTIINVDRDYSYEDAQEVIENGIRPETKKTDDVVLELDRIAKKMRAKRIKDSLEMNSIEVKFKLDEVTKKPVGVFFKQQKDSNKLIEEYMLLANKEVAKFIKSKSLPCVNRVHESPDLEKIEQIKNFVFRIGYEFDVDGDNLKSSLNQLIKDVKDTPEENIVTTLITRAQKKAIYSTKNIPHYGLGFKDYSHFTSPIRRFSDILTHRLLSLALGNDGYPIK